MDELLAVLNQQLQQERPKLMADLLTDRRLSAYKFLDSAYFYTDQLHDTEEPLDSWERKLVFALNYAVGLPKQADRDELRREIAYARDFMGSCIQYNPEPIAKEDLLYEVATEFSVVGDLV
jgi:hypothetical protein